MLRFLLTCAFVVLLGAPGAHAQTGADAYRIEIGDRLAISVLEDPGLNQTVLVRPDGRITVPLAGTIEAQGRTPEALQSAIRTALGRDFIEPPTVTVAVVGLGQGADQPTIYVLGSVGRPGPIQHELPLSLLQALSLAGGPSAFAANKRIQVRRFTENDGEQIFLFDYDKILEGLVPGNYIDLADGDIIIVPQRGLFE